MQYMIISGPKIMGYDDGKTEAFTEVINEMIKEGWRPQGGVSIMHLTGASAVAACGADYVYHGVDYLAQAMVHDDDNAGLPEIALSWFAG